MRKKEIIESIGDSKVTNYFEAKTLDTKEWIQLALSWKKQNNDKESFAGYRLVCSGMGLWQGDNCSFGHIHDHGDAASEKGRTSNGLPLFIQMSLRQVSKVSVEQTFPRSNCRIIFWQWLIISTGNLPM